MDSVSSEAPASGMHKLAADGESVVGSDLTCTVGGGAVYRVEPFIVASRLEV